MQQCLFKKIPPPKNPVSILFERNVSVKTRDYESAVLSIPTRPAHYGFFLFSELNVHSCQVYVLNQDNVNFSKADFVRFEFKVFSLLDRLPYQD